MDKDFLTSYYRDEMKAKGIDADYDVRLRRQLRQKKSNLLQFRKCSK